MGNIIRACLSGIMFGLWPILMQKSGLTGFLSAAVFASFSLIIVGALSATEGYASLSTANWKYIIAAGLLGGIGLAIFTTMLAKSTTLDVSTNFLVMLMFQLAVPAINNIVQNNDYSPRKIVGIIGSFIIAYLLRP